MVGFTVHDLYSCEQVGVFLFGRSLNFRLSLGDIVYVTMESREDACLVSKVTSF